MSACRSLPYALALAIVVAVTSAMPAEAKEPGPMVRVAGASGSSGTAIYAELRAPDPVAPLPGKQGHLEIWDQLAAAGMMGVVTGVVCIESDADTPLFGAVAGHMMMAALGGFFTEPMEVNPFVVRHPPPASSSLFQLKQSLRARSYAHAPVRIMMSDGSSRMGRLQEVKDEAVIVRTGAGRDTISEGAIRWIDTLGDNPWDQMLWGMAGGAGWALIAANNFCEGEHVRKVSRGRMAVIGAAILGATGLVMDLMHDGKFPLYRRDAMEGLTEIQVGPVLGPGGPGLGVSMRF